MNLQTPNAAAEAAVILAERRRSGVQGARLPLPLRPQDAETALAIQAAVSAQLGERIGGWKCGLPVEGQPVAAPIYANTIHNSSPCTAWVRDGQVRVEPELAFVLAHDLPTRSAPYTKAEIDAAIGSTHLALELIDSRYSAPDDAGFIENLSDGLLNQGLYLGPQVDTERARAANTLLISVDEGVTKQRQLQGRHPNGEPRAPLYWLAEFLRTSGQGLQAGQIVITGSYAGSFGLPLARDISIRYGDMGVLRAHFLPK
ncbi:fumarylacetoacetate (FAA) hydrolase family protein [Collimonas arenae]|uniref:Fumarylacetoacetate (FAA) hydrolase family protein n=1 Tax=Collimonas arenae TaxID=279058 RepID=A0A127QDR8_9BURK|nr:hypothetical protein [Collimonas arenae]AMO98118.1 fumarylacetoacetate (FAA) hydrolase family protein [Collimonas arenae]AMP07985.1 fumarylacetoacetate (FAA) hydrolase family protein [Collimonas arenae]